LNLLEGSVSDAEAGREELAIYDAQTETPGVEQAKKLLLADSWFAVSSGVACTEYQGRALGWHILLIASAI
jgi:hypothetical protein